MTHKNRQAERRARYYWQERESLEEDFSPKAIQETLRETPLSEMDTYSLKEAS